MDALLTYVEECKGVGQFNTTRLSALVSGLKGEPEEAFLDMEKLELCKGMITSVAACSYQEGVMYLQVVLPELFTEEENAQTVPESTATATTTEPPAPETRNHAVGPASRRAPFSSVAEGSRLRQRNLASMTNDEYDARAASIQPNLVNTISNFAAQKGLGPSAQGNLAVDTTSDARSRARAAYEQPTYSDSLLGAAVVT
ncbi:hypothetical protein H4S07_004059 [Coemansia furcata]|uniref:Uncharacterized protein n=1 Tax=Coemansia furcata TaxID=417177 RepID=A0ACC1LC58_9FUNG|nr:hypothetical protein H4S07_004059 [Coemansia furcata]